MFTGGTCTFFSSLFVFTNHTPPVTDTNNLGNITHLYVICRHVKCRYRYTCSVLVPVAFGLVKHPDFGHFNNVGEFHRYRIVTRNKQGQWNALRGVFLAVPKQPLPHGT